MQQPFLADAVRVDTFHLVSALDAYAVAATRLVERWFDADAYADVQRRIDTIRDHGVTQPALTVLSLQLVIAHAELVSTLWQNASADVSAAHLQEVRARHAVAVELLRAGSAQLQRSE